MKVLLINPPQTIFPGSRTVSASVPLGLSYIAAVLHRAGHRVQVIDALTADYPSQASGDEVHVGAPWPEIQKQVAAAQPDVVGISNPFTTQVQNAARMARVARQAAPGSLIIVGGPHVTVQPLEFLKATPEVDVAVVGEGEQTVLEVVSCLEREDGFDQVSGIAYREMGQPKLNPPRAFIQDLDALPFPGYDLLDMERYLHPKRIRYRQTRFRREMPMITSRGCPFNCVFCSIHLHMGHKWRAHSSGYVLAHIEHVLKNHGVQHIHFEDDNFTLNAPRLAEIMDGVLERGLKFTWDTPNGVRADGLTLDMVRTMKRAGCLGLNIGIESGDQEILDKVVGKHLKLEAVVSAAEICQKAGVKLSAFYIIGFPGETMHHMRRTLDFALRLKREHGVDMELFHATPLWGTRLHDICQTGGYLVRPLTPRGIAESVQNWGQSLIQTGDFTPEDVKEVTTEAMRKYNRLRLREYLKNPLLPARMAISYPGDAGRFIRSIFRR